ncbi:MAG: alanine racemase [Paracoccaceae bacterium]|nr:alanine racemase [Paracoccaceae bacterium]MDE2912927.1 alanine racemase [Paracoccaceae bacterium]
MMFLDVLLRRNPAFIEAVIELHQQGRIPANSYVLDLDAIESNASLFRKEAERLGMATFAMTKQVGRHSGFCQAVMRGGIRQAVAVDMQCAIACERAGMEIGHLGHLVQVPRHEAGKAAGLRPEYWTVFSEGKAGEAAAAASRAGHEQKLMARIQSEGDIFYFGHEGGFAADAIVATADAIDATAGAVFAGITTFPALLFDPDTGQVAPTPNLATLSAAADALRSAGRDGIEINAPGTTSSAVLGALADAGATQCEPGNGLHGTTPLHAVKDLPEVPAVLYLSEVSHLHHGRAFCFGGGLYIDPVFPDYDLQAIVSRESTSTRTALARVEIPPPSAIDYYGLIDQSDCPRVREGDSVVFGFRGQAFVTRANVVGVSGVSTGRPEAGAVENGFGDPVAWH